jgi:hypothetical protein
MMGGYTYANSSFVDSSQQSNVYNFKEWDLIGKKIFFVTYLFLMLTKQKKQNSVFI